MSGSTTKAFQLLFYIADIGDEVSLARLAGDTGWDKATALRYLGSLEKAGAVERREGGWTLGLSLVRLAARVPVARIVAVRGKSVLERLATETGETVNLAVRSGQSIVYLAKAEGHRALAPRSEPGDRLPFHCTAVGKATLSLFSDAEIDTYCMKARYEVYTPATIATPEALKREIDSVRRLGYAVDREEYEAGLVCVAVPVEIVEAGFQGAVSVSGPSSRMVASITDAVKLARQAGIELVSVVRDRI